MKKVRRIGVLIVVIILTAVGSCAYQDWRSEPQITSSLIMNQLTTAKELTTSKYMYTNMGSFENNNQFYGWDIPLTGKKFIVSYNGVIHTGIDLDKVEVKVDGKQIKVHLPKAGILSHEIDEDSLKIFDQKQSIFNPIKVEDYTEFVSTQKKTVEKEAIDKGLLDEADKQAKTAVKEVIDLSLQGNKEYTVEVE